MPFDPAKPAANAPLDSQVMRDPLNALNDAITAATARIAALEAALANTAQNPHQLTLNIALDDPPNRPQVQAILDGYNGLLNQITRV